MDHHTLVSLIIFGAIFLALITLLQRLSERLSFPYTIVLLLVGFASQLITRTLGFDVNFLQLSPDMIFYILLPVLLFEAAIHINLHQFRLQFKTISFMATFGLLVSVFTIAAGVSWLVGLPLGAALLFGTLISATDPIAVLSLFKSLGAPKRLALLADGESMFNDATAVIAFRLVSALVLAGGTLSWHSLAGGMLDFVYVFWGSLLFGSLLGYTVSRFLSMLNQDRILVNAVTASLALGSFISAEHFLGLSGVISTVMAGITIGNVGRNKISVQVIHFIEEFWAFLGFVAVSLVFYFATFNLRVDDFVTNFADIALVVMVVLIARAVSVYVASYISNRSWLFRDEPNIPRSWQHILTWGGLRGVIPLVLVYTLPDSYPYKDAILSFTLATLFFTLVVNGLTIKWLLIHLGLHLRRQEEAIIDEELQIFDLENAKEKLISLPEREFDATIINEVKSQLNHELQRHRDELMAAVKPPQFLHSLRLQALAIERETLNRLYHQGRFNENVFYIFESELDLQLDALEHPEVYKGRAIDRGGLIDTSRSYRKRLIRLRRTIAQLPFLAKLFHLAEEELIEERFQLLRARLFTSYEVMDYLKAVEQIFSQPEFREAIDQVKLLQERYIAQNLAEIDTIKQKSPEVVKQYQRRMIHYLIKEKPAHYETT